VVVAVGVTFTVDPVPETVPPPHMWLVNPVLDTNWMRLVEPIQNSSSPVISKVAGTLLVTACEALTLQPETVGLVAVTV
tara:strand:+ start:422 stop:658 length:237 start_codon:yes stop_codon:yes gene_type:complete